ncbi:MAG: NUDIX hydrolase [Streptosporangiaceae bacterium]
MPDLRKVTRVAAYAVLVQEGSVLLSRWVADTDRRLWSMPGGGVEHGEDPTAAAVREVAEETGYSIEIEQLLGIHSVAWQFEREPETVDFHGIRIVYSARITGGTLRYETGGSSDMAAWTPREQVASLDRVSLVEAAIRLYDERPASGHLAHA